MINSVQTIQFRVYGKNPAELQAEALKHGAKFFNAYYSNGEIDQSALTVVLGMAEAEEEVNTPTGREITQWGAEARVMYK